MAGVRATFARLLVRVGDHRGIMLIELVLAASLSLVIFGGAVTFFVVASNQATVTNDRVEALDRLRDGFERLQRDVHQAQSVSPVSGSASAIELTMWVRTAGGPQLHAIRWDCSGAGALAGTRRCSRENLTAATGRAELIDNLADAEPFTVVPAQPPAQLPGLRVTLTRYMPGAVHPLVVHSTVTPRNCVRLAAQPGGTPDPAEQVCEGTT